MQTLLLLGLLAAAAPPAAVHIEASDSAIVLPAHVASGLVAFTLDNRGSEPHEIRLVRVTGTHTFDDFVQWQKSGQPIPDWLEPAGGLAAVAPGLHQKYVMSLDPGTYVALDSYPSADGTPHSVKGLFAQVIVDKATGPASAPPEADITIAMTDHHFLLTAPFEAPHPMIHLKNNGSEPHQAQVIKLSEERQQFSERAWFDQGGKGTRPGQPIGGSVDVPPDGEAWFRVELRLATTS